MMKLSNKTLVIIVAVILLLAAAAAGVLYFQKPAGTQVYVTVNGQEYGSYPLHKDAVIAISPADGSWHNTLTIQNGTAAVTESDCDNQICVYTPALTEDTVGIIVCLPHGVAVELKE